VHKISTIIFGNVIRYILLNSYTYNNNLQYITTALNEMYTKRAYLCYNCIFAFSYITNWILLSFRIPVTMSICHNNPVQMRSSNGSNLTRKIDFLICNKCIWLTSLYTNMKIHSNIRCPICNDSRNLESMPIYENESRIINILLWYECNLMEI